MCILLRWLVGRPRLGRRQRLTATVASLSAPCHCALVGAAMLLSTASRKKYRHASLVTALRRGPQRRAAAPIRLVLARANGKERGRCGLVAMPSCKPQRRLAFLIRLVLAHTSSKESGYRGLATMPSCEKDMTVNDDPSHLQHLQYKNKIVFHRCVRSLG